MVGTWGTMWGPGPEPRSGPKNTPSKTCRLNIERRIVVVSASLFESQGQHRRNIFPMDFPPRNL